MIGPTTFRVLITSLVLFAVIGTKAQVSINADYIFPGGEISTCNTLIAASGGNTNPVYGPNEDFIFTVCSDTPGDFVSIVFTIFALDLTDTNPNPNQSNADVMYVYDGTSTAANLLGNYTGNELQGVLIQATPQNVSGCLTFRFVSNNGGPAGQYTASATCLTPCATPQAGGEILNGITEDSIRVCVNEPVSFQEVGSLAQPGFNLINYTWDFDDDTQQSLTNPGATVTHSFAEPGYYLVQLFVQDDNPDNVCTNTNFISLKVLVATEPEFLDFQDDVGLCIGEELTFVAMPELYEVTYTGDGGLIEVDNGCLTDTQLGVAQNIDIQLTEYIDGATITSVDDIEGLCLSMEHSFMGDLVVYITCPTGQQLMLHQQGGGGTQIGEPNPQDNIDCDDPTTFGVPMTYCFTPDATETWVEWVNNGGNGTLVEGDYEPIGTFNDLIGCPANGIWTLTVVDNWASDDGQLFSFSLNLGPDLYPDELEFTPEILPGPTTSFWSSAPFATINDSNLDEITINPSTTGTYVYEYTVIDDFGCANDASFTVTVFDGFDVIAPPDLVYACNAITLDADFIDNTQCTQCVASETYCYDNEENYIRTFCTDSPGNGAGISFEFISGEMEGGFEDFFVYDGATTSSPELVAWTGGNATGQTWTAQSGCITIELDADGSNSCVSGQQAPWEFSVQATEPILEWSWTPINLLVDPSTFNQQSIDITNIQVPTEFTVTGWPIGRPGCSRTDEVLVIPDPLITAGESAQYHACPNDPPFDMLNELQGNPVSPGTWFFVDETDSTDAAVDLVTSIFNPMTSPAGYYLYEILQGCTAFLEVTLATPLSFSIPDDTTICSAGTVNLFGREIIGEPAYNCQWTFDGSVPPLISTDSLATFIPGQSGMACLKVIDGCNVEIEQCFDVEVLPVLDVIFSADTTASCWPASFQLAVESDPAIYTSSEWILSNGTSIINQDEVEVMFDSPGNYAVSLKLSNAIGCTNTSSAPLILSSFAPPVAGYIASPQPTNIMNPEIQFTDMTEGYPITSYLWTFYNSSGELVGGSASANPTFEFSSDYGGEYTVNLEVTDIHNCTDVITPSTVTVDDILQFYIPTAFTPNGDGVNDELFFEGADIDPTRFEFKIFNRFGQIIFETADPSVPWVGNIKDGDYYAPNGPYNWIATIVSKSTGVKKEMSGSVLIAR
jgi:gliding motility-associated-like protein